MTVIYPTLSLFLMMMKWRRVKAGDGDRGAMMALWWKRWRGDHGGGDSASVGGEDDESEDGGGINK